MEIAKYTIEMKPIEKIREISKLKMLKCVLPVVFHGFQLLTDNSTYTILGAVADSLMVQIHPI